MSAVSGGRNERGVALAVALFALVIIGALVGSSFVSGRVEHQSGQNSLFAAQAREAAEAGLADAIAALDPVTMASLPPGALLSLGVIPIGHGTTAERELGRLTGELLLVRSRGRRRNADGAVLATCVLGTLVQVGSPAAPADTAAGLVSAGPRIAERGWIQLY